MNTTSISKKEQENILFLYWQLLTALESKTDPKKDLLDKEMVRAGYNILNRIGYTDARPQWEEIEKAHQKQSKRPHPVEFENVELGDEG